MRSAYRASRAAWMRAMSAGDIGGGWSELDVSDPVAPGLGHHFEARDEAHLVAPVDELVVDLCGVAAIEGFEVAARVGALRELFEPTRRNGGEDTIAARRAEEQAEHSSCPECTGAVACRLPNASLFAHGLVHPSGSPSVSARRREHLRSGYRWRREPAGAASGPRPGGGKDDGSPQRGRAAERGALRR